MGSALQLIILAISLALDAVSVSIAGGIEIKQAKIKHAFRVALFFALAQAIMPLLGWFIGNELRSIVTIVAPWIASSLLIGIGIFMVKEARDEIKEEKRSILSNRTLFLLAIATSIDAFLVGITLGIIKLPLLLSVTVIGVVTFLLCWPAFLFASHLNRRFEGKLDMLGGFALILLGCKVLLTALLS